MLAEVQNQGRVLQSMSPLLDRHANGGGGGSGAGGSRTGRGGGGGGGGGSGAGAGAGGAGGGAAAAGSSILGGMDSLYGKLTILGERLTPKKGGRMGYTGYGSRRLWWVAPGCGASGHCMRGPPPAARWSVSVLGNLAQEWSWWRWSWCWFWWSRVRGQEQESVPCMVLTRAQSQPTDICCRTDCILGQARQRPAPAGIAATCIGLSPSNSNSNISSTINSSSHKGRAFPGICSVRFPTAAGAPAPARALGRSTAAQLAAVERGWVPAWGWALAASETSWRQRMRGSCRCGKVPWMRLVAYHGVRQLGLYEVCSLAWAVWRAW